MDDGTGNNKSLFFIQYDHNRTIPTGGGYSAGFRMIGLG